MRTLLCLLLFIPGFVSSQNRYDVVISEIMADPSPTVGLPANEWIELKNTSSQAVNLQGWRIGDASSISGPLASYTLLPDSFVIICGSSAVAAMSVYGPALTVTSFPSLDNNGDLLVVKAANGRTIHAVSYNTNWYQQDSKKEGGWSLEMADTRNPCAGATNWIASSDNKGGTPGQKNSADRVMADNTGPRLLRAYTSGPTAITLVYNEPVDSLSGATSSMYTIDGGLLILKAVTLPPLFTEVQLTTSISMSPSVIYTIEASAVKDCLGNSSPAAGKVRAGLANTPGPGEWIINELLFNPVSNGDDYAEFLNNSNKILDASRLFIASRNSAGALISIKPLYPSPYLIFPGEYILCTTNAAALARQYLVPNPDRLLELPELPSFPDDEGTVVALNFQGEITDELHYLQKWHFKLLSATEGISLERIDPKAASQDEQNWHSAASTAGYGTPGYQNSQYNNPGGEHGRLTISPPVFSPDNDGRDDVVTLQYAIDESGYVATVTIYDASGKPVRNLVRNALLGLTGYWNWDGLDDNGNKLPVGTYVVFARFFNLQGKKTEMKQTLVLARYLQ
ncbi:MAG: lamin tail domain-containing protein [Bacteroidetes bacterium]|nr:lamin tail domain-containing protein [Bacteroidota bacterium]